MLKVFKKSQLDVGSGKVKISGNSKIYSDGSVEAICKLENTKKDKITKVLNKNTGH